MAQAWKIEESRTCGIPCIRIIGAFDFPHTELSGIIKKFAEGGEKDLVMDLRETSFFTSQGLASVIIALKHVNSAGGKMYILGPTKDMRKVLRLTLLEKVLLIADDEAGLKTLVQQ